MIKPGLERISRLLKGVPLSWRAVHVAGTNGKGSICAHLSALFHVSGIRCGRFTSPHLIDRWDCITVDEKPISKSIFREVEKKVQSRNSEEAIEASEFEVLTATAFEIFERQKLDLVVVECGLGGRLDATNVLEDPLTTVISRIGLDHQGILGDTYKQIAFEKAGIITTGATCIVDATSDTEALEEVRRVAKDKAAPLKEITSQKPEPRLENLKSLSSLQPFEKINLRCAYRAYRDVVQLDYLDDDSLELAAKARLSGRFQTVDISKLVRQEQKATLDGAHNVQAWENLRESVKQLRGPDHEKPVTWVIACSQGKDSAEMFKPIPASDRVVLTEFGPVDGMPWVKSMAVEDIMPWRSADAGSVTVARPDPLKALQEASRLASDTEMVIAGSLYLVSDVLRLLRDSNEHT